jgi:hypothetical protein
MVGNSYHNLWCLVAGDSTPFEVTVHPDASISSLKKLVFEDSGITSLYSVVATDLTLWKVLHFHNPEHLPTADRFL